MLQTVGRQQTPHPPNECPGGYRPAQGPFEQRLGTTSADMTHLAAFQLGMLPGKAELPLAPAGAGAQMDEVAVMICLPDKTQGAGTLTVRQADAAINSPRSEEHTSELQSRGH